MPPSQAILFLSVCALLACVPAVSGGASSSDSPSLLTNQIDSADIDNAYPATPTVRDADVGSLLMKKLGRISARHIGTAISRAAERHGVSEDWLERTVFIASRWGSMGSIDEIVEFLERRGLRAAFTGRRATLADVIFYLRGKKCEASTDGYLRRVTATLGSPWESKARSVVDVLNGDGSPGSTTVLLLDDITLARSKGLLSDNSAWKAFLAQGWRTNRFVTPYGWVGGLTMFTQVNYKSIINRLAARLARALPGCGARHGKKGEAARSAVMDCAVDIAILWGHPLWSGVPPELIATQIAFIDRVAASSLDDYGPQAIQKRLAPYVNPDLSITPVLSGDRLAEGCYFDSYGDNEEATLGSGRFRRNDYVRYLMEYGTLVSMQRLGQYALAAFNRVVERFPDKRYYCIMEGDKSTNIAYHLWFMVTEDGVLDMFDCGNQESVARLLERPGIEDAGVLIVDDLAVSGTQLRDSYAKVKRSLGEKGHVRAVPLLFTGEAAETFSAGDMVTKALGGRRIYEGGIASWMLELGFGQGAYSIALPYMSPDNTNAFFAIYGARSFTYHGCGVKSYDKDVAAYASKALRVCQERKGKGGHDSRIIDCLEREHDFASVKCYGNAVAGSG